MTTRVFLTLGLLLSLATARAGEPKKLNFLKADTLPTLPEAFTLSSPTTGDYAADFTLKPSMRADNMIVDTIYDAESNYQLYTGQKSPLAAAAFSAVLPGAGEFYTESYVRSGVFLAAEVIAWIAYFNTKRIGHQLEQDYVNYANAPSTDGNGNRWSAERYAERLQTIYANDTRVTSNGQTLSAMVNQINIGEIRNNNYSTLNAFEREAKFGETGVTFSHTLPAYGAQQYYELIGKYDTYTIGWDDYTAPLSNNFPSTSRSPLFLDYARQRGEANETLSRAGTVLTLIVVNHLLSAIDAVLTTGDYNRRFTASVQFERDNVTQNFYPRANMKFSF